MTISKDDLQRRRAELSPEQQALLKQRMRWKAGAEAAIPRVPRDGDPSQGQPLSFAQQRLWFLDQLEPDSPIYNLPHAIHMRGPLDRHALQRSFDAIIARHESLRTIFVESDGVPAQQIVPPAPFAIREVDLRHQDDDARAASVRSLGADEARRPFDLAGGPLLRATLLRLAHDQHVLLLTMHHIISDGWSMSVFTREMIALYSAFVAGRPDPLPLLSIQYADFAVWQRRWLSGAVLERQLDYWRQRLAQLPVLDLPTDYPRPPAATARSAAVPVSLPAALSAALAQVSQRAGVTLFMTLLATFQALLARYTGQTNIVVGTPLAGRERAQVEPLIGFFINQLVIRADFAADPTFGELLRQIRATCVGAYEHQDLPFEMLVEQLQIDRDLTRNPLFQVVFILQNVPAADLQMADVTLSLLDVEAPLTQLDLKLVLGETAEGLRGSCVYNAEIFAETTVRRMLGHFTMLLEALVADQDARNQRGAAGLGGRARSPGPLEHDRPRLCRRTARRSADRGPRRAAPRHDRADLRYRDGYRRWRRSALPDIRGAERARQPTRPLPASLGRHPRGARGRLHGADPRPSGSAAGHPEGRRGVRAARP